METYGEAYRVTQCTEGTSPRDVNDEHRHDQHANPQSVRREPFKVANNEDNLEHKHHAVDPCSDEQGAEHIVQRLDGN